MPEEQLTLVASRHEYDDVYTYFFKCAYPPLYKPGWYGHMRLYDLPPDVKTVREFSLASAPHEELIQLGIDHSSQSPYQEKMRSLKPGDHVALYKLKGHMSWPPEESEVVMIAGGIGITPIRSFLMDSIYNKLPHTTHIIHVSSSHYLYSDEIEKLTKDYRKIGRDALKELLEDTVESYPRAVYYVVGSMGFVEETLKDLTQRGVAHIENDIFKGLME